LHPPVAGVPASVAEVAVTIQGGGGGRKVPPGGPARTTSSERPSSSSSSSTSAAPSSSPPASSSARDGFEQGRADHRRSQERAPVTSTSEPTGHSGIESTLRLLETRRDEILDEHRALREKAWRVVGELARGGFERAVVEQRRAELAELRQRLAHQRRRLQLIKRRWKAAAQRSTKHGDLDVSRTIQAHLEKMKKLEPGVQKALLALQAMEQAFSGGFDVNGQIAGATVEAPGKSPDGGVPAETVADALARVVPGAVVAVGVAHVLARGPGTAADARLAPPASSTEDTVGNGLHTFAGQLLSSL
jgi:hypothetical protein